MRNGPGEHTLSGAFLRLSVISKNKEPSPVLKKTLQEEGLSKKIQLVEY